MLFGDFFLLGDKIHVVWGIVYWLIEYMLFGECLLANEHVLGSCLWANKYISFLNYALTHECMLFCELF